MATETPTDPWDRETYLAFYDVMADALDEMLVLDQVKRINRTLDRKSGAFTEAEKLVQSYADLIKQQAYDWQPGFVAPTPVQTVKQWGAISDRQNDFNQKDLQNALDKPFVPPGTGNFGRSRVG